MYKNNTVRIGALPFKIDHTEPLAVDHLSERVVGLVHENGRDRDVVIVCIGTDRSTGDALGPLIGSKLSARITRERVSVYGTLDAPVHAVNLKDTITEIQTKHVNPFVIAVDACLGQLSSVGLITLANGPLKPGAGVNKVLPEVGNIHLTGIVNVGGFMEYFVLQNTRLSVVMKMADCIADAMDRAVANLELLPAKSEPAGMNRSLAERIAALRSNLFPTSPSN